MTSQRSQARTEMAARIQQTARAQLRQTGANDLSLRAVARELGLVSSAVYKYVPSRTALLTLLIVASYEELGAAALKAERAIDRADFEGRFLAVGHATRSWALKNPAEYSLLFGTPLSDYEAPAETIEPGTRIPTLLSEILREMPSGADPKPDPVLADALRPMAAAFGPELGADRLLLGLTLWESLVGLVLLETFGHIDAPVSPAPRARKAVFDAQLRRLFRLLG